MVPSFRERKPHGAARTAVPSFVLHPVVSGGTARLVTHRPAENPASTIAHEDPTVVLGDAQGSDLGRVCVVLPVKGRVHSQLTPEHQLPFPPVPGLQSAEIPRFSGIGVGVIKGSLQVRSGLAL